MVAFPSAKSRRSANFSAALCLLLMISFPFVAQGRAIPNSSSSSSSYAEKGDEEEKLMRSQIGSRPPRCEALCMECRKCEAVQVPANPNIVDLKFSTIAYARGEDDSNYKPMSWKCKCGSFIFDP